MVRPSVRGIAGLSCKDQNKTIQIQSKKQTGNNIGRLLLLVVVILQKQEK